MSLICVQQGTYWEPELFESDDPVKCAECGKTWDRDEDSDAFALGSDGQPYCTSLAATGRLAICLRVANRRAMEQELKDVLLPLLEQAYSRMEEIGKSHGMELGYEFADSLDQALVEVRGL